jgi:hypothetical protein
MGLQPKALPELPLLEDFVNGLNQLDPAMNLPVQAIPVIGRGLDFIIISFLRLLRLPRTEGVFSLKIAVSLKFGSEKSQA